MLIKWILRKWAMRANEIKYQKAMRVHETCGWQDEEERRKNFLRILVERENRHDIIYRKYR